ncbi:MAG TPA: nitroreductase family protein, partial [Desulfobaccales bacterium]
MKISRKPVGAVAVIGLVLALMWQPALMVPRSWAQEKAATITIPKGTKDGISAILTRRSIREYTPHPVPDELIKLLLEAGTTA